RQPDVRVYRKEVANEQGRSKAEGPNESGQMRSERELVEKDEHVDHDERRRDERVVRAWRQTAKRNHPCLPAAPHQTYAAVGLPIGKARAAHDGDFTQRSNLTWCSVPRSITILSP